MDVMTSIVVFFVCFAQVLKHTGAGEKFTQLAFAVSGQYRGGPAKAAVIASAGFGMLSGSVPASIAAVGSITIPLMKRTGYSSEFSGAVETVASTGGSIMPPVMGSVAFLIAEFLGMSYGEICIAAFLPAVLYYLACFLQVDGRALKMNLKGLSKQELPAIRSTLTKLWVVVIPITVLVVLLVVFKYRAAMACLYAIATLFILSMFQKESRVGPRRAERILSDTTKAMMSIIPICLAAGFIMSAVGLTGVGINISQMLIKVSGGNIAILVLIAGLAVVIMSMGLPAVACYIIPALLIAPALVKTGVPPLAAHLFIYYVSRIAFITPPVCIGAYVASAIAESKPMRTGYLAMRLGIVAYILPFVFIVSPGVLMIGTPLEIAKGILTLTAAVIGLSAGIEGYLLSRSCNLLQRIALVGGSVALIIPDTLPMLIGAVVLVADVLWIFLWSQKSVTKQKMNKGWSNK